jgi:hypothetical protein
MVKLLNCAKRALNHVKFGRVFGVEKRIFLDGTETVPSRFLGVVFVRV